LGGFLSLLFSPCCFLTGNPCRHCVVQYWRSNFLKIGLGGLYQLGQSFSCTVIIQQNALLSRISTISEFRKLMLDLEIYVDGLADMQIKSLNFVVDTSRKALMKRHNPDEYNLQLNTLKAQHLELNEYFSHVIDDDMHAIIKDIRNAHKGDIDSAPPKTITEHWEEILEKAENFAGTSKQKLAYIFTQFLKIKPTEKNIDDMADIVDLLRDRTPFCRG
jgi:hypothetical protein